MLSLLLLTLACASRPLNTEKYPFAMMAGDESSDAPATDWLYAVSVEDFRARVDPAQYDACQALLASGDRDCMVRLDPCTTATVHRDFVEVLVELNKCPAVPASVWTVFDAEGRGRGLEVPRSATASNPTADEVLAGLPQAYSSGDPFINVSSISRDSNPGVWTPLWISYVPLEQFRLRVGSPALDSCLESMELPWESCRVTLDACTTAEVKPGYVILETDIASCAPVAVDDWVVIDSEGVLQPLPISKP